MKQQNFLLAISWACVTMMIGVIIDMVAHLGATGLFAALVAAVVAWRHGPDVWHLLESAMSARGHDAEVAGMHPPLPARSNTLLLPERCDWDEEDEMPTPRKRQTGEFLFSSLRIQPSIDRVFLARTAEGIDLYCAAKDLCHVALAGSTGEGKSSILRMLMLQLCAVRLKVILLNPHYTGFDIEANEDWTPFDPYLAYPPLECMKSEVIEHYLKQAAETVIPGRLEKRAYSEPFGRPYFIVIDELKSIVRSIPDAPSYMRYILEEGRKVGVFLISASHDFLVKSISPKDGGGSIRECYRTAYYVGGDATTAKAILDLPQGFILPEDELGKGTVMFRGTPSKKASQVYVPYVDNESLYRLLGPSTYVPKGKYIRREEQDDLLPPQPGGKTRILDEAPGYFETMPMMQQTMQTKSTEIKTDLHRLIEAYKAGTTTIMALSAVTGFTNHHVRALLAEAKYKKLI